MDSKVKQMYVFFLGGGVASTAAAVANVTNASVKSSTVPLQTTLLACEPSGRKSKDTVAV